MTPTLNLKDLSFNDTLNRCYYLTLIAMLDIALTKHVLIDSLNQFQAESKEYPFVKPAEIKPGGIVPTDEHGLHNTALVMILEDALPLSLRTNIRTRRKNEINKANLSHFTFGGKKGVDDTSVFREIISEKTMNAMKKLLHLDMALVGQRDRKSRTYGIKFSNFHVQVNAIKDTLIKNFAVELGYLNKDLLEGGEDYAELLESKFYETFGMKCSASGRRTAAIMGHRLLYEQTSCLHTVYCGSSESRCLYKINGKGNITRTILIELRESDTMELASTFNLTVPELNRHYLLPTGENSTGEHSKAATLSVTNMRQPAALPAVDKEPRAEISQMERWITTESQHILPLAQSPERKPLPWNWLYRTSTKTN